MADTRFGQILAGSGDVLARAYEQFEKQAVDWDLTGTPAQAYPARQRTLGKSVSVQGPGTFFGKAIRKLTFEPTEMEGWWFSRDDLPGSLPVQVSIRNVWTTGDVVSNIVLRSGAPQNYIRMVEHIVALRLGLGIDNVMIRLESGDPPLFKKGSLDLVEALDSAGVRELDKPVPYVTVKEPVSAVLPGGNFLIFLPHEGPDPKLIMDTAIDFKTAIGLQRLRVTLDPAWFRYGAEARTNTSFSKMLYCRTIGKLFADIRNLGYTSENVLIASRWGYLNEARHVHEGKSLEAVWHRTMLDLLAAVALIDTGRFAGRILSYKAGHQMDCEAVRLLYKNNLLCPVP